MNRLKLGWMAWVAALLMTSLSGCATYMASQSTETTTKITKTLAYEDAILGMGQPTGENISAEARNFLALIGEKQTYLLTEGADEIKAIVKNLDGRLIGVNQDQPKINMLVQQDSSEIQSVRGDVTITYNKAADRLTEQERKTLTELKFTLAEDKQSYWRSLHIQGVVYPPVKNLAAIASQFKQTRPVQFYKTEYKQNHNPLRAILLPLGVAFDVITAPIQIPFWYFSLKDMKFM
ncbi:MAG: hypothetical protein WAS93_09965 [Burkholderiaceae bacterium]